MYMYNQKTRSSSTITFPIQIESQIPKYIVDPTTTWRNYSKRIQEPNPNAIVCRRRPKRRAPPLFGLGIGSATGP
jgi:hypothetical protein